MLIVDLNADLGEGYGRWTLGPDDQLLEVITSANVACGFHAGDPSTLRRVCDGAAARGVRVGAQVSYHDLVGFGRRSMDVPSDQLRDEVIYQIGALDGMCRVAGTRVTYVKPHGALYNRCFNDHEQAAAVVDAIAEYDAGLSVLGQADSALVAAASARGLPTVSEVFADRAYAVDGSLIPRSHDGSVIHDVEVVAARVVQMATSGTVGASDGTTIGVDAQSICLHSDTPGALALASAVRDALARAGVELVAFT